jgi:hypothetical protein
VINCFRQKCTLNALKGRGVQHLTLLTALTLALTPTLASPRSGLTPLGNPSEIEAAEGTLARLARDRGANAALAMTAEDGAEFIAPVRTPARTWLKSRDAAAWFADRQTATIWASCDGTAGVSAGLWRNGWFATVWKRQKKLDFKWLLADAAPLAVMPPAPDWITGKVADCPVRGSPIAGPPAPDAPAGADSRDGRSDDGSLVWRSTVRPDGSRALQVWVWRDGAMQAVIDRVTPARAG